MGVTLPRNCGNCQFWDGDVHCSLPVKQTVIIGAIVDPEQVVCSQHEPKTEDDK